MNKPCVYRLTFTGNKPCIERLPDTEIPKVIKKETMPTSFIKKDTPKNHYVDKGLLHAELSTYALKMRELKKEAAKEGVPEKKVPKQISNPLARMFELLVKNIGSKYTFSGYPFLEDMKGEAILNLVNYADRYDPDRFSNAYGYLTKIIWQSFTKYIQKEKRMLAGRLNYIRENEGWVSDQSLEWLDGYNQQEEEKTKKEELVT